MLILSRRIGESLIIGENITIEVLDFRGSQVRIGVKAPEDVVILREELVESEDVREALSDWSASRQANSLARPETIVDQE